MSEGLTLDLDSNNLDLKVNDSDTITFHANEILIGADFLALKFKDIPLDLTAIKSIVFQNMDGSEIYEFKKL